ncbi:DUF2332 domain-containing protein [Brevundimonas vesicularis]|uniref:DUF2332 domain-containing protein n=1 Tax=Brevundimonas vesicularis TaxID=41276 RepID=UPI003850A208
MTGPVTDTFDCELAAQAERCRAMGSPFIADVLEAAGRQLACAPLTAARIRNWQGDQTAAALALRLNGALHALARAGRSRPLSSLYRREHTDFDGAVADALAQNDQFVADWVLHPPQTNEVARAAALMAALMAAPLERSMPFELLELGSSCGLNLNLDRYAYALGPIAAGDPFSDVRIEPQWRGDEPKTRPVSIASARGVDLQPLNAADPAHRERLLAFAWADQPARTRRLEHALRIAAAHRPRIDQGDAVIWLADRLAEPQAGGCCRVLMHTMVLQYLSDDDRRQIAALLSTAGRRADAEHPLLWISFEWTRDRTHVELRLTAWPTGETRVLAHCHPYGDWLEWLSPAAAALAA